MQFNKKVILAISVTASVVVYLTHHSSSKQQQKQQQQHYDVLERVFALHFNSTTKEDRRSMIQNDDNNIAQKISSSSSGYRDSSADSRNLFNIIGMMGGELEVDEEEGPWGDYSQYMTLYSSTPFNPRQYSGEDTEFLHYKDPTEQDKDGTTTFPPTNKPIQQNTWDVNAGKPSADPTEFPTSFPVTLEPTKEGETRHPTREPTRRPTKLPTREPTKFPTKEPTKDPSRRPTPNPSRLPTREPTIDPTREPTRDPSPGPTRLPSRLPTREPTKEPTRDPSRGPTRLPSKMPTREPTKEPTMEPIIEPSMQEQTTVATPNPTKRPTSGSFYCGKSVEDASSCKFPCPGGISDCPTGFCYAVSQCIEMVDAAMTPGPTPNSTPKPSLQPTQKPTTDDFYCGNTLADASSVCEFACPSGSPSECPDNLTCYASTGCLEESSPSPTRSPSFDPSGSFYCGSSFQEASQQCLTPCPSGLSSDCPTDQACYANTPCSDKDGFFCGTSIVNASASCEYPCTSGLDAECPAGLSCYETQTCKRWGQSISPTRAPIAPAVDDGTKYCGYSYEDAATTCTQPCKSGLSEDCPEGMSCFSHTPCEEKNTFYCGVSWNNAASSCRYPCPSGKDSECPLGTNCYAYTTCDETDSFMCGKSFEDASSNCDKPCPTGSPTECPSGESCFTHTTCKPSTILEDQPTAAPVAPYIPGDSFFCGTSYLEASSQCTHPCPTRSDLECPDGEQCYGNTPCPNRGTYYCGANLDEASAICEYPCPTGRSEDCPTGLSCFAFTTCADKDTFYCGDNYIEASGTCDTPCPSGLSSDCPEGLTCFAHTTCTIEETSEEPVPSGPTDSYFCGSTFDQATTDCSLPCPTGKTSDCPAGMSCYTHTSCADRDSFMCGYSWESASASCSNPCPSGEHSDCPEGMSCFAYTPCNNDASYFCGISFDEASDCAHPCPSGESSDCPSGLSCFSYTTCGTGDFNTKVPTSAPTPVQYVPTDSFYCGKTFDDASSSCEYECPNGATDCPTGLACHEFTTCVGGPSPSLSPTGEHDSFYCGKNYVDANEKCLVPCPDGNSNVCPSGESCIPFTTCNEHETVNQPNNTISTTFYCGTSKEDADGSCNYPCPKGKDDCPDGMSCYSFTACVDLPINEPTPVVPNDGPSPSSPGSLYCGTSFENATSSCSIPCPGGRSDECPTGQSCYGYTSCDDRDSFYCGTTWDEAASTCSKPCPSGSNDECDSGKICFGYTPCGAVDTDIPVDSFFCGATFEEASLTCSRPCPSSKHSDCPDGEMCFPYTPCGARDSMYCGTSWTDAATSCLNPCPSGSSSDCPAGQFCFPSTPCNETDSFFCGSSFEEATSICSIPCSTGQSSTCPNGQGCFAYTLCNEDGSNAVPTPTLAPIPVAPPDSYFCGSSFDEASSTCEIPCPSGQSDDCPDDLFCFASTPCSDKGSFFCGVSWEQAASTCTLPCESGLSSDCPDGQKCFGYTPCSKTDSFYCGTSFDEASSTCTDPCPSGLDEECPGSETCHKYTPCNDSTPSPKGEPDLTFIPEDSFYCGVNFTDASNRCYLPCPSGSASECPVGEACYGNIPCSGGDSFFCGTTWYDAASKCKVPCPSGLDEDCPAGSKCFGYTPCSDTNSYYCGVDFYDASTSCLKPCPTGSSSECPEGLACFPNTPCDSNDGSTSKPTAQLASKPTFLPASSPVKTPTNRPTKLPTKLSSQPTASIQQLSETTSPVKTPTKPPTKLSSSSAPHVSMFLYCGTDIDNVNCLLPCPNGDECPLGHECYATTECSETFFCGQSFADANTTCAQACPDGLDTSCPKNEFCFAQTSCANPKDTPVTNVVNVGSFYCGKNYTDASTSCPLACPSGSTLECAELGPDYSCFSNTPCDDSDTFFCGTSWNHAASNCLFPCKSGLHSECPDNTFCFPYTTCNDNKSFMCGTSFEDASTCLHPCPSGSSNECPFGQSCFTHTTCSASELSDVPTAAPEVPLIPQDSFYCGISFLDAATQCTQPCPTKSDSECPEGEKCFANTPCSNRDTYYCGRSLDEASSECQYPCPTGSSDECPEELACFAFTTCTENEIDNFYCGATWKDAATSCLIPCPSGMNSDCPLGQFCFPSTPCDETDSFFCGSSFEDASASCSIPCDLGRSDQCPDGQGCFAYTLCNEDGSNAVPTQLPVPVPTASPDSYYCGVTFDDASTSCTHPCPSGQSDDCPDDLFCFASTSCDDKSTFFCGVSWEQAASTCALPCESGLDCPDDQKCFSYTPCSKTDSFYCGTSFDEASSTCTDPCPSGLDEECPGSETCHKYTPCADGIPEFSVPSAAPSDSYYCGTSFDDASRCIIQCPSGLATECPMGEACFARTTCSKLHPETFFCGSSFLDASSSCAVPCEDGVCPDGSSCYAYTPCAGDIASFSEPATTTSPTSKKPTSKPSNDSNEAPIPAESYFCGLDYMDASNKCTRACPSRNHEDCPSGESCYAYTPCMKPESFFCGTTFDKANESCTVPCPTGSSDSCPTGESCFAYTTCKSDMASFSEPATTAPPTSKKPTSKPAVSQSNFSTTDIPAESYFCGLDYMDASNKCTRACPSRNHEDCPSGESCYAYTPCMKPESFFCGTTLDKANESCTVPCPTGSSDSCPTGESCFAYTTCKSDMASFSEPATTAPPTLKQPTVSPSKLPTTFKPTNEPTPNPTRLPTNNPTNYPTKIPTKYPTNYPTKLPTKFPTKYPTASPTKSPIVPVVFDVPIESFYCGASFEHATQICGVPCPNGLSDCPQGLKCYGNTPCADRMSFFCGTSYDNANESCTKPCPSGNADECDYGQSCFAYTMCRIVTGSPTEEPTFKPTFNPTNNPTQRPTVKQTPLPTVKATQPPVASSTPPPVASSTPPPTVKESPNEPAETPAKEESAVEMSEAVVIELKPCDDPLAMTVNQAYWRSWSSDRPETCNKFEASDIDDQTYTHLVYSFASISAAGLVEPWAGSWDEVEKYKEFNKVKQRNPEIKTIIAVTEGIFYGGGMNPVSFTEIVETQDSRMVFAQSVVSFLDMYDFDGIDLDWEAPLDRDKGGSPDNFIRYVELAEEIRSAIEESGKGYLLTIALPGTDWEQLDYDIVSLSEHVDWFNLNTFDYHTPKNIPKTVGSHSDLKMIDAVIYNLLTQTIPTKFVLGMAAFGRTYTLADDRCKELNCPFRSPGLGGCGNTPGFLPFAEISEYIDAKSYDVLFHDISSSSMVAVVDSDQMISFDNEETWAIKEAYAEMMCLRGTMLWSIDMLKAPSSPVQSQTRERALAARGATNTCSLCGGFKLFSGATIEYDGDIVSCAKVDSMLTANFVPQESDQCTDITLKYHDHCCAKAPSTPCNICGAKNILEDKLVRYSGIETTCEAISESFLRTDEHSFSCSLAKSLIPRTCCADSPAVDEIQGEVDAFIETTHDELIPCNICHKGNAYHALKADTMVEYKGAAISCLDVNSILAKSENIGSEMCDATQALLFEGCCYEKCSLCNGEESLNKDVTVKYNEKVLSCDEMSSIFTLGATEKGSEQCDAMQSAYASSCCYKPPEKPCNLCARGSTSYKINTRAFVKTHSSSSSFCVDVLNRLAAREEEGSEKCMHSKAAFFSKCCDILSLSTKPIHIKPHDLLTENVSQQSSGSLPVPSSIWALFFVSLIGVTMFFSDEVICSFRMT